MELTEEMLRIIAENLTDLRLRVDLLQKVALHAVNVEAFEKLVKQARETPSFQESCDRALEELKGHR